MQELEVEEFKLAGLALNGKTTNEDGQSSIDCGSLWQRFEEERITDLIPDKVSEDIFAVYHQYEGDHTQPFAYFIGCRIKNDAETPDGLDSLILPKGNYKKFTARGKMPECVANTWRSIWSEEENRTYQVDFEVYDDRSKNWDDASVDIFVSVE